MLTAATVETLQHDRGARTLTLLLEGGLSAHVAYRVGSGGRLDLFHSEVPAELRGRGIGRALAVAAVQRLKLDEPERELVYSCTYLAKLRAEGVLPSS